MMVFIQIFLLIVIGKHLTLYTLLTNFFPTDYDFVILASNVINIHTQPLNHRYILKSQINILKGPKANLTPFSFLT